MTGELWIDAAQERVTRLEGHLQQDTDYGWGILGKLDKGGWIVLEQAGVGAGQWRIARFQMKMNLRILFKTKNFDTVRGDDRLCAGPRRPGLPAGHSDAPRRSSSPSSRAVGAVVVAQRLALGRSDK